MPGVQNIGNLYDAGGVVVGQAAGFIAPANTALPADHNNVFDPTVWSPWTVGPSITATSVTFTVATPGQVTATSTSVTVAGVTTTQIQNAIGALASVGGTANVTVTIPVAGTWKITFLGPARYVTLTVTPTGGSAPLTAPAWVPLGATDQGWQVNFAPTTQNVTIEEQPTPIGQYMQSALYQFIANLAEDTVLQLGYAYGWSGTTTANGVGQPGKVRLVGNPTVVQYAMAVETLNRYSLPRVYYTPTGVIVPGGSNFRRADNKRMIPFTYTATSNMSQYILDEVVNPGT